MISDNPTFKAARETGGKGYRRQGMAIRRFWPHGCPCPGTVFCSNILQGLRGHGLAHRSQPDHMRRTLCGRTDDGKQKLQRQSSLAVDSCRLQQPQVLAKEVLYRNKEKLHRESSRLLKGMGFSNVKTAAQHSAGRKVSPLSMPHDHGGDQSYPPPLLKQLERLVLLRRALHTKSTSTGYQNRGHL